MIDCGGQGSFINAKLSQSYQLPLWPKPFPISLILADGSPSQTGSIIQYNPLLLCTAGNEELLSLDVAPISHDIILSMPWLRRHDFAVCFGSNQILFDSPYCEHNCGHFGKTIPLHPVPPLPPTLKPENSDQGQPVATGLTPESSRKQPVMTGSDRGQPVVTSLVLEPREALRDGGVLPETCGGPRRHKEAPRRQKTMTSLHSPRVSTVGVHAFALLCNQPSMQLLLCLSLLKLSNFPLRPLLPL